jgi:hypothetical protein
LVDNRNNLARAFQNPASSLNRPAINKKWALIDKDLNESEEKEPGPERIRKTVPLPPTDALN